MDPIPVPSRAENLKLTVVIPLYNEEECFSVLLEGLLALRPRLEAVELEIIFVDDGSRDRTLILLNEAVALHNFVKAIQFSRNFGHQAALTAGLDHANGDYVCVIDADLQDPPEIIPDMLEVARQGYDVVYGQRRTRAGETWFKKITAALFYRILSKLCQVDIPADTGDFRLMSRRAVLAFREMREAHRFVRGMVAWVGFRSIAFPYDRRSRHAGKTKYPLFKMLRFATDAILSFSNLPLRISTYIGLSMTGFSLLGILLVAYLRLFTKYTVPGISAVLCLVFLTSGVQFIILGMIGEYIGRIFEQGKRRPLYLIAATANIDRADS